MIELPIIVTSGVLGSSHCMGMCGPFAALIGNHAESWKRNLLRQLVYSAGRIFTYMALGATAGAVSYRAAASAPSLPWVPALLAALAGFLLIKEGLATAGILRRRLSTGATGACARTSIIKSLLVAPTLLGTFLAGIFTGFLPCGLVYAFLALAVQTGSMMAGITTMLVFGLCTVPVMVATGCSVSLIPHTKRQRMVRLAGWALVVAGFLSVARGWGYLPIHSTTPPGCPLCVESPSGAVGPHN